MNKRLEKIFSCKFSTYRNFITNTFTFILFLGTIEIHAQTHDYDSLITAFGSSVGIVGQYTPKPPLIYENKNLKIRLANSSLGFETREITLKNPNPIPGASFPLSYSVIFKQNIVALFEPGIFVCFRLSDFSRNVQLEQKLNTQKFKHHWLFDNQLYGFAKGSYWYLNLNDQWISVKKLPLPLNHKSILYSDRQYIIYNDCNGEWGGTIYFYDRYTKDTYFTEATCANTVIKTEKGFKVLSHLGHGSGSADLKFISNPTQLPNLKNHKKGKKSIIAIGYKDSTSQALKLFDFYDVQLFSVFEWKDKTLYVVHFHQSTFLAEVIENEIIIVDPMFNADISTNDPITKSYDTGEILISLDLYTNGMDREIALLLIKDSLITKINWNQDF